MLDKVHNGGDPPITRKLLERVGVEVDSDSIACCFPL